MKRKERELEHEMERLAKEKIAAQNRILLLKRELSQWDIECPRLVSDIVPDRGEPSSRASAFIHSFFCIIGHKTEILNSH